MTSSSETTGIAFEVGEGSAQMATATAIVTLAALYLAVGVVIGAAFVVAGISRVMPHAGPVTAGARILILPGCVLLWPVVLRRWIARR
jgi:hypothetical protein